MLTTVDKLRIRLALKKEIREMLENVRRNGDFYGEEWTRNEIELIRNTNHTLIKVRY